ncbi:benzoate 1,2-dioxygenase electron transfer component BenC [Azohydromonas aeria]|uniref:benzoate 1,2-dioxygenase electron transfer component BenC n=1 Tax=Azohydromonas aeria TaxID=2590212 RepID=UPI0012FB3902|nr:benzoate 1,2-dioxygenase electron transfer component BenC [Azohydromonas aeria]
MPHQIALRFEDGLTRFIEANPNETVADAAYRQGVNIPLDCRDGACGTCKCHAESGKYEMGEYIEDALSEDEAARGYVLTCQMRARGNCVVQVPASSAVCRTQRAVLEAAVGEVRQLSPSTISLTLRDESLGKLAFLPGQYVNLQVPGTDQTRAYSFSSLVREGGEVSFLIRNVPGGLMSGFLTGQARPGDRMTLTGPLGSFYLREIERPLLLLAGGTGLAPFTAMLEKIAAEGSPHPLHLVYGVTTDADLVEMDRLEDFAARIPNFTFAACVASPESAWPRKGYVTHHIEPAHLYDGEVDVYLCGPPPMVEAVSRFIRECGVKPASFHYEKFAASA